ncbi:MAG TPA: YggT family protein [Gemmatimonadaceae bacterium]|nr:YggT family protein [Gemmatimonadaceae bacterium]
MPAFLSALAALMAFLRIAFFAAAAILFVVFLVDWLVRTRRINPFNPVARFFRKSVDPLIAPVERRVIRAGGLPTSAPWWSLVVVVVVAIIILGALDWLFGWLQGAYLSARAGPTGVLRFLIATVFGVLQIALLVRVISSWLRLSEWRPWLRWAVVLTEPILRPLRALLPPLGGVVDLSPLIAWLLLGLIQSAVLSLIR